MPLLEELQSALHDRYSIVAEIGRGGMATVYKAEDLRYERTVAIKLLSPDLSATIGAERFLREIRIATRLTHPHILPVYDSGETHGLLWYVMPFIQGESLRDRLDRDRQLPIEDAIAIAGEAADALGYAHQQGVVHRDVKPENILLQDGHAVIADFGIARAIDAAESDKLTMTGTSVGTAAYMSPEQFSGMPVDGRADIYSLGCVLYEMLVGQTPFTGANPLAIMARATMEAPPAIRIVRNAVPEEIESVVALALQKVAADRFRTMDEFKRALFGDATSLYGVRRTMAHTVALQVAQRQGYRTRLAVAAAAALLGTAFAGYKYVSHDMRAGGQVAQAGVQAGPPPSSIAVLYFTDESPDGSLQHVADGLTESLIEQLADVQALDVISANGVRGYRGVEPAVDSIGHAFAVGTLVRGSVAPAGDGVTVHVELWDAGSSARIDRRTLSFPGRRLIAARDSVGAEVAAFLRTRLGNDVRLRQQRSSTESVEAWTAVQRAEKQRKDADSVAGTGSADAAHAMLRQADAELARASALDARWPEPHVLRAAIALTTAKLFRSDPRAAEAALKEGHSHVARAMALDPRSARAHDMRGQLFHASPLLNPTMAPSRRQRLLDSAEAALVRAVSIDKKQAGAWATLSGLHYVKPDLQQAMRAAMNAYDADAYLANARTVIVRLFSVSYDLEQWNEANRWCAEGRRRFPRDPYFVQCQLYLSWSTKAARSEVDSVWAYADRFVALSKPDSRPVAAKLARVMAAGALARAGLADSARAVLRDARVEASADPHRDVAGTEAVVRVILGEHDEAIRLIKDYLTVNPDHLRGFATRTGWWWREIQDHPTFVALLAGAR